MLDTGCGGHPERPPASAKLLPMGPCVPFPGRRGAVGRKLKSVISILTIPQVVTAAKGTGNLQLVCCHRFESTFGTQGTWAWSRLSMAGSPRAGDLHTGWDSDPLLGSEGRLYLQPPHRPHLQVHPGGDKACHPTVGNAALRKPDLGRGDKFSLSSKD